MELMVYLLLTITYVVSGKLGLMLSLPPGYASPIFPFDLDGKEVSE